MHGAEPRCHPRYRAACEPALTRSSRTRPVARPSPKLAYAARRPPITYSKAPLRGDVSFATLAFSVAPLYSLAALYGLLVAWCERVVFVVRLRIQCNGQRHSRSRMCRRYFSYVSCGYAPSKNMVALFRRPVALDWPSSWPTWRALRVYGSNYCCRSRTTRTRNAGASCR